MRASNGSFVAGSRSFQPLLKHEAVQIFASSYPPSSVKESLYALKFFLDYNNLTVDQLLQLSADEKKLAIRKAIMDKQSEEKYASARVVFYAVTNFLELNNQNKGVTFSKRERRHLLKLIPKKGARKHIPSRDDVYRMVDNVYWRTKRQRLRARAIVLCLWQSGVRVNCLCSWTYGMFRKQLFPEPQIPVKIKVVPWREEGDYHVAVDSKLARYANNGLNYYYTFLAKEATFALKEYLEARIEEGWIPKKSDPVFVTECAHSKDKRLTPHAVLDLVKLLAKNMGIDQRRLWTHCFRAGFRKALYHGRADGDTAEAMMGHKLPYSRGNYFDYTDMNYIIKEYNRGTWHRIDTQTVEKIEDKIGNLEQENKELKSLIQTLKEDNQTSLALASAKQGLSKEEMFSLFDEFLLQKHPEVLEGKPPK